MRRLAAVLTIVAVAAVAATLGAASSGAAPPIYVTKAAKSGAGVGFYATAHLSCPAGYHVLSGGYLATNRVKVVASWPESDTGWAVKAASTISTPRVYYIFIRCRT